MSEKQQTAVEWLFNQLTEIDYGCINKTFLRKDNSLAGRKLIELFEQAKELEKKQIEDAYLDGYCETAKDSQDYYSKTYSK